MTRREPVVSIDSMAVLEAITPAVIYSRRSLVRDAAMVVVDANLAPPAIDSLLRQALKHRVPVGADPTSASLAGRLKPHSSRAIATGGTLNDVRQHPPKGREAVAREQKFHQGHWFCH